MTLVNEQRFSKHKQQSKGGQDVQQAEFVNYDMSDTQRAECKAWDFTPGNLAEAVDTLVGQGYALSVKRETASDAYAAFLRAPERECDNSGLILSGRGSTPVKSVKQLLFKHFVIMAEDWRPFFQGRRKDVPDD